MAQEREMCNVYGRLTAKTFCSQELQNLEMDLRPVPERWKEAWDKVKAVHRTEIRHESRVSKPLQGFQCPSRAAYYNLSGQCEVSL